MKCRTGRPERGRRSTRWNRNTSNPSPGQRRNQRRYVTSCTGDDVQSTRSHVVTPFRLDQQESSCRTSSIPPLFPQSEFNTPNHLCEWKLQPIKSSFLTEAQCIFNRGCACDVPVDGTIFITERLEALACSLMLLKYKQELLCNNRRCTKWVKSTSVCFIDSCFHSDYLDVIDVIRVSNH